MYGLVVRFELLEGHEQAFDELVTATIREIETSEPKTLAYVIHKVVGSPRSRVFYEFYEDAAAFEAHEASTHVRRFLAERGQHLIRDPDVWPVVHADGMLRDQLLDSWR